MKKLRLLLPLLVASLVISAAPQGTSAHEVKISGSLSVLLHMEPQDSPVVNEPAQLFIAVSDTKNAFDINTCSCSVSIKQKDKTLLTTKLEAADTAYGSNVGLVKFAFPKKGI